MATADYQIFDRHRGALSPEWVVLGLHGLTISLPYSIYLATSMRLGRRPSLGMEDAVTLIGSWWILASVLCELGFFFLSAFGVVLNTWQMRTETLPKVRTWRLWLISAHLFLAVGGLILHRTDPGLIRAFLASD